MVEQTCDWPSVDWPGVDVPDALLVPPAPSLRDAAEDPAGTAAWLACGPVDAQAVAAFAALDPAGLPAAVLIDVLAAARRVQAWLAGLEHGVLAAIATAADQHRDQAGELRLPPRDPRGQRWVAAEVGAVLRIAGSTADARLDTALALTGPLTATGQAVTRGQLTAAQAAVIAEETALLDAAERAAVQARVLPRAATQPPGALRRTVRRAVKTVAAETDEQQHQRAVAGRRVTYRPHGDGTATVWALLPADDAQTLWQALNSLADRDTAIPDRDGTPRTLDQRRADALADLGSAALTQPDLPRRHGTRPTIAVTVALSTLLGCDQQPGLLDGYGPIPASMARRIAADPDSTWRRLLLDPAGRVIDYGRSTYRPPADLAEFVLNRDRQCVFPGCTRTARDADIDHHRDWDFGGLTNQDNLGPLCPKHHRLKHQAGWSVTRLTDGRLHWRSPTGHHYINDPDPNPLDTWTDWTDPPPATTEKPDHPPTSDLPDDPPF